MNNRKMLKGTISITAVIGLCLFLVKAGVSSVAVPYIQSQQIENIDKIYAGEMVNVDEPKGAQKEDVKEDVENKMGKAAGKVGGADIGILDGKLHSIVNNTIAAALELRLAKIQPSDDGRTINHLGDSKTNSFLDLLKLVQSKGKLKDVKLTKEQEGALTDMKGHHKMGAEGKGDLGDIFVVENASPNTVAHEIAESIALQEQAEKNGFSDTRTMLDDLSKESPEKAVLIVQTAHFQAQNNAAQAIALTAFSSVQPLIDDYSIAVNSALSDSDLKSFAVVANLTQVENPFLNHLIGTVGKLGGRVVLEETGDAERDADLRTQVSGGVEIIAKGTKIDASTIIDLRGAKSTTVLSQVALLSLANVLQVQELNTQSVAFYNMLVDSSIIDGSKISALDALQKATGEIDPGKFDPNEKLMADIMAFLATSKGA